MWIKELYLKHYGPLSERTFRLAPGMNLLRGDNDQGKTLTIEALLKLFFPRARDQGHFCNLERVEHNPTGHVLLVDESPGNPGEVKLDGTGGLAGLTNLSPREYRNLFVIKDSDLSPGADEADFYDQVTRRLTGLRTRQLQEVMDHLREQACLTPEGRFRNAQPFKLKDKLDRADALTRALEECAARMEAEGFAGLKAGLVDREREAQALEQERRDLEDARRRETWQEGRQALDAWKAARQRREELAPFNREDGERWREAEQALTRLEGERERVEGEGREKRAERDRAREERECCQRELETREATRRFLEDEVRPELRALQEDTRQLRAREESGRRLAPLAWIATVLLFLSLLGLLTEPAAFWPLTLLFLAAAGLLWRPALGRARAAARLAARRERLQQWLAPHGLQGEDLEAVSRNLQQFAEIYEEKKREKDYWERREEQAREWVRQEEEETRPRLQQEWDRWQELVRQLAWRTGAASQEEFGQRLQEKERQEAVMAQKREALAYTLRVPGEDEGPQGDEAAWWEERLQPWKEYADRAVGVQYDEARLAAVQTRRHDLEEELSAARELLRERERELAELQSQLAADFAEEFAGEPPPLRTALDLAACREGLEQWRREREQDRRAAIAAIELFQELWQEEQSRVEELFGPDSGVSRALEQVTGGLYREARFDSTAGHILCRNRYGAELPASSLSGGSFDQLYFAVRLALGQDVLGGQKGFFVLDDPFVRADYQRLQRQMEALLSICRQGWQVLYFSAKKETAEALEPRVEEGRAAVHRVGEVAGA